MIRAGLTYLVVGTHNAPLFYKGTVDFNTQLYMVFDPYNESTPSEPVSFNDLDEETTLLAKHDGPFGLIYERRTVKEIKNGSRIEVGCL